MKKRIYIIICIAVVSTLSACNKKLDLKLTAILFVLLAIWDGHGWQGTISVLLAMVAYGMAVFGY